MMQSLAKKHLLQLLDKIMQPKAYALTESEGDEVLREFCSGCPDPEGARWLIVECLDPMTDEEIVDRVLAMPPNPTFQPTPSARLN